MTITKWMHSAVVKPAVYIVSASLSVLLLNAKTLATERPGIGVILTDRTQLVDDTSSDNIVVSGTVPGQPAAEAGIMAGDFLLSVNGESVRDLAVEEAVALIERASLSSVELTLRRDSQKLSISLAPTLVNDLEEPFFLSDGKGQAFSSMWIPTTRYTGSCPGVGYSPTFNNISALSPIPLGDRRRIIITNQRTGGYTDRAYDGRSGRSQSFDIAFGDSHTTRYFTVSLGQNVLTYKIMEDEEIIGEASVLLSVEQRFNDIYRPASLIENQMVCPAATPYPTLYPYTPYPYSIPN